jgi:ferric-dicitrate binding protein FerR (iron transport regulator)
MSARFDLDELFRLFGGLTHGTITQEEHRRLQDILANDAEARRLWFLHSDMERGLTRWSQTRRTVSSVKKAARPSAQRWLKRVAWAALAASLVIASTLFMERALSPATNETQRASSLSSIATLLLADDCEWSGGDVLIEGQPLITSQKLQLAHGMAVLRFDGGAEVVMEDATELELESRGSVRLLGGRLTVRASDDAVGFIVHTVASDVTDLGTEFAVSVSNKGATEVHVLEGQVALGKPGSKQSDGQLLRAGKAVRIEQGAATAPTTVPLSGPRFAELLDVATAKPCIPWHLAAEPFDYPLGSFALEQANGGQGWNGPWGTLRAKSDGSNSLLEIATGQLNQNWPVAGGHGSALKIGAGLTSRARRLAQPVRLDRDGIYYLSLMVRQEVPPGMENELSRVAMGLRSPTDPHGDRVMFRVGTVGNRLIEIRSGENFNSPATVARRGPQYWVGKIIARAHGEDEIFFRVYEEGEPLDIVEPASWSVRTRGIQSNAQLDYAELWTQTSGVCWFDELRIGTNWRGVVFTPRKQTDR